MNLLIPYRYLPWNNDPLLEEFTYGDFDARARKLRNDVKKGDYLFFHATIRGKKSITAYYVVDRILDAVTARKDKNIKAKYKNDHLSFPDDYEHDEAIVFGDPITSRKLDRPLLFDKTLAEKLSLNIKFPKGKTETQTIGSATRNLRELTEKDVNTRKGVMPAFEEDFKKLKDIRIFCYGWQLKVYPWREKG